MLHDQLLWELPASSLVLLTPGWMVLIKGEGEREDMCRWGGGRRGRRGKRMGVKGQRIGKRECREVQ